MSRKIALFFKTSAKIPPGRKTEGIKRGAPLLRRPARFVFGYPAQYRSTDTKSGVISARVEAPHICMVCRSSAPSFSV